jgi:RNA polymerase sigma-70 factor (ECF subfamily)
MAKPVDKEVPLENLMRLAQSGDKKAYAALFRAIMPLIKAFVSRRITNMADVDDVVQDTLLSIHRAGHTYDTNRPFKVWMFTIARHRLNDCLRRNYRKATFTEISLSNLTYEISLAGVTERWDQLEYLNKILDSLPEKQKKIVTMMKIEGYTAEDAAKKMNMSVSAVKVAAHRAYKSLALKLLKGEES